MIIDTNEVAHVWRLILQQMTQHFFRKQNFYCLVGAGNQPDADHEIFMSVFSIIRHVFTDVSLGTMHNPDSESGDESRATRF